MNNNFDLNKKTLALITGASKGIGQRIAIELSKRVKSVLKLILLARSKDGLETTKRLILKINKDIEIQLCALDLSTCTLADCEEILKENFTYDNAIIFHNAGSLGDLNNAANLTNVKIWESFYHLNLFSASLLNSVFLTVMARKSKIFVINISSLCGSKPFKNMAMYGSGKAARNLYFGVLAAEEKDVTVLNYSPGPVDTDMVSEVILNVKDAEMKSMFVDLKEEKKILTTEMTITKLINILEKGDFNSGDLIDYYDRV